MKVLLINHFPLEGSGSGIYTKNLAERLYRKGHDVKVIYIDNEEKEYEFDTEVIKFNTEELSFDFPCFTTHPKSSNTFYNLSDNQLEKYVTAFTERVKNISTDFNPDIIHTGHVWVGAYAASKTGIPYIITAHGTDLMGYENDSRYHKYVEEAVKNANGIIAISEHIKEKIEKVYGYSESSLILNGYDEDLFFPTGISKKEVLDRYDININPKYIVCFAGKFTKFKGIDVLLRAAKIYEEKLNFDVVTILAGNGEEKDSMTKLSNELKLKNVFMLGHVNQDELVSIYNVSDVSTMPSRKEPFGLVAIEAIACGTPVVATKEGGTVDFITEEVGALIDQDDYEALAEKIIDELTRTDKLKRADNCHEYAFENFSLSSFIDKVEALYNKILTK
ncbi:MAG: glycosyltransferase family 4 protein [Clostridia bacterium]|jgi:glycosyltransferase involved in cell wall biosynthesis|nr:glycosyltransferase family 4 protein [Clostridia bacterium]